MLHDIEEHIRISKCIDVAEERAADSIQESLRERWLHGRMMLEERKGKQLPKGRMAELVAATGCSQSELSFRMRFAERYPTEDEVCTPIQTFASWIQVKKSLPKPPSTPKPEPEPVTYKRHERYDEVVALFDQGFSVADIAEETGMGNRSKPSRQIRHILEREKIERHVKAESAPLDWESIPATAKQKLEIAQRQIRHELEAEVQARVTTEIKRIFERTRNEYEALKAKTDRILDAHTGVFTKAEFGGIQACLHPDSRLSVSDEKLAEAFRLFRSAEDVLVGEKEQPTTRMALPSLDELKKRRAAK